MVVLSESPLTLFDEFLALFGRLVGYSMVDRATVEAVVWGDTRKK